MAGVTPRTSVRREVAQLSWDPKSEEDLRAIARRMYRGDKVDKNERHAIEELLKTCGRFRNEIDLILKGRA